VRHCVRQFLHERPFAAREIDLMVLGVDEACTNIIRHAYHLAEDQPIRLSLETCQSGGVRFRLRDFGVGFDGTIEAGQTFDNLRPGGLGMHLIRHAFDQVDYHRKQRGTLLVLTKHQSKEHAVARSPALA
jgi:anti-sigma regulatory factor (Ser/Thr protein kinase)